MYAYRMKWFTAALLAGAISCSAQTYNVEDLGAAPGDAVSAGYGLNAVGQAVGTSSSPTGAIATLFSGGAAIDLGTLEPNDIAVATGLNRSAEIVGYEPFSSDPNNTSHAFLYRNGVLTDLHSPVLFPAGTRAAGINGVGEVVGTGFLTSQSFHAFLYSNGSMVDIGPAGAYQASAVAVNDSGQVVGSAFFTNGGGGGFVYSNGQFTYLIPPGGAAFSPMAISSNGLIAGTLYVSGTTHAAIFSSGTWTDLGGISGAATRTAGVNSNGQVVATAIFPQVSYHPPRPGKHVGLVRVGGGLVDLNTLIVAGSGFTITDAIAINDAGQILCNAKNSAGAQKAVLLTPR